MHSKANRRQWRKVEIAISNFSHLGQHQLYSSKLQQLTLEIFGGREGECSVPAGPGHGHGIGPNQCVVEFKCLTQSDKLQVMVIMVTNFVHLE